MTTYTIPGFRLVYDDATEQETAYNTSQITVVSPDNVTDFSYSYNAPNDTIATLSSGLYNSTASNIDGSVVDLSQSFEVEIFFLDWGAGNRTFLLDFLVNINGETVDFLIELGGDALPTINNLTEFNAFAATITGEGGITGGPFGPGQNIPFNMAPGVTISQDDTINGGNESNIFLGGVGNDTIFGGGGNDTLTGGTGRDSIDGGAGTDTFVVGSTFADVQVAESNGVYSFHANGEIDTVRNVENFQFLDQVRTLDQLVLVAPVVLTGGDTPDTLTGDIGSDVLDGGIGNDSLDGGEGNDRLLGGEGDDTLFGGDGTDTLNAGVGDDVIHGGDSPHDLRDIVYGGDGNDCIDGGYGNDLIFGQDGDDKIIGGFGSDTLNGQNGNDVITGSALSDLVSGNAGDDFVNGGFGHDRINGGTGADRFFHLGIFDHGSDWIQDYSSTEGDLLLFGNASATRSDFQINYAHTATPAGERSGDDNVAEAFVIYRPTGQIMWALVDGQGQDEIILRIGSDEFDLLA